MKNIEKVIKDLCRKDREANLRKMGLEPDEGEGLNENNLHFFKCKLINDDDLNNFNVEYIKTEISYSDGLKWYIIEEQLENKQKNMEQLEKFKRLS